MILWLVLLFRVLSSTAENFFSPILTQLSQEMGLPPRFAGGTTPLQPDLLHPCSLNCASLLRVWCIHLARVFLGHKKAVENSHALSLGSICSLGMLKRVYLVAVTFLALGNGAPDISSSIAAISSGNYELALGALLGERLHFQVVSS